MSKRVKSVFLVLIVLNLTVLGIVAFLWIKSDFQVQASKKTNIIQNLKTFSLSELAKYNGIDPKLPIYLALDGFVYDISKGSEFYKVGGPYHDLAGKDSSVDLHLVGGGIIKRKYPIVGKLKIGK